MGLDGLKGVSDLAACSLPTDLLVPAGSAALCCGLQPGRALSAGKAPRGLAPLAC